MNSGILKFTADYLHDGKKLMQDQTLITDDKGKILDVIPTETAGEDIQVYRGLLCPGFVNAHCHLELSHLLKKIPEDTGLVDFLISVMQNRDHTDPDEILQAAEKAEQSMAASGIVAVGDISNKADSIPIKQKRNLFYHTFIEAIGFYDLNASSRLKHVAAVCHEFRQHGLAASIAPHAPYSVSRNLFHLINDISHDTVISIHNQECEAENKLYKDGKSDFERLYRMLHLDYSTFEPTGKSSLKSWMPYFNHHQPIILVHNTFTSETDISFAGNSGHAVYWCLCPNANAYIESCMPPVDMLIQHHAKIILGTDSLASNHQLSILEEIKTLQQHFPGLSMETMLAWGTLHGAEALGCTDEFGSFEKGKRPGIIQLHPISSGFSDQVMVTTETQATRRK